MADTVNCSGDERRILVVSNTAWSILNFRSGLIRALAADGFEVCAAAPRDEYAASLPCRFEPIRMDRGGTNPVSDLRLCVDLCRLYRRLRPGAVLHFTSKINIYGSLAARGLGIRSVANVSGLGSAFLQGGIVTRIQQILYRHSLRHCDRVFFQNPDDLSLFRERGLVPAHSARLLPGSGVDLEAFHPVPRQADGRFRFLMIARIIRDKGVREYVQAARQLGARYPHAEWCLLGALDAENPSAISAGEAAEWSGQKIVRLLGRQDDVRGAIAAADCVVLPSYREGTPRTLLEGAAMGKPLITTDVPGCRQVVEDGVNGFLCPPRDGAELAAVMVKMLDLPEPLRAEMGRCSRGKMEREFDQRFVIQAYRDALREPGPAAAHPAKAG